jgi:hypothetical protein
MKMISGLASAAALLAVIVSAPGQAAPPSKIPSPSAQLHTVADGNRCTLDASSTMLSIPLANGNPNAIIVAAINLTAPTLAATGTITIFYDSVGDQCNTGGTPGRWILNVEGSSSLVIGQQFNIIVMNPAQ